ncbi:MAG: hypothetical protein PHS96_03780 [Anaerolineales bacterium]|nr:hypothetical protein [Anaerolineales bacterium]
MDNYNQMGAYPIPRHYDPARVGEVWRTPYQERFEQAQAWARQHGIQPAGRDRVKIALILVDVQNTFCIPEYELFVGGRSGMGAVEDNQRLCEFIYHNLGKLTHIMATMDTHQVAHIFHSIFLVNEKGEHPAPMSLISAEEVRQGRWRFNPDLAEGLGVEAEYGQKHLVHYVEELEKRGKYALTIWPYHAMLGGIGHALVSAVEEAIFFHSVARSSQPGFDVKGRNPLTEHYSAIQPEVMVDAEGEPLAGKNERFMQVVGEYDAVALAGQAKSHCVSWTVEDLLEDIRKKDPSLARKVYLLEDCTSAVVVPEVVDYSEQADEAFRRFAEAGMHLVRSSDPLESWPGMQAKLAAARS